MKTHVRKFLWGAALIAPIVGFGFVQEAKALEFFVNDFNKLAGVPVATDENYFNVDTVAGGGNTYLSPHNLVNGAAVTAGARPGQQESVRVSGASARLGINLPQPHDLGDTTDSRAGVINPVLGLLHPAFAGRSIWGARTAAVVQWQTLQDGVSTPLSPLGHVTGVAHNMTPGAVLAVSGPLVDDGLSPGSAAGDGIPDFLPFVPNPLGGFVAAFTLDFIDLNSTVFAAPVPVAMLPRLDVYEDTTAIPTLLDISGPGAAFPAPGVVPSDNDGDGVRLLEGDFDHNTGLPVTAAIDNEIDQIFDNVADLILTGTMYDLAATLIFRTSSLAAGSTITLDLTLEGKVLYDGGTQLGELLLEDLSIDIDGDGIPDSFKGRTGTIGASITGINWNNFATSGTHVGGTDPSATAFDFAGFGSASANQSFTTSRVVPEPVTAGLGMISLAGLAAYAVRRRRA